MFNFFNMLIKDAIMNDYHLHNLTCHNTTADRNNGNYSNSSLSSTLSNCITCGGWMQRSMVNLPVAVAIPTYQPWDHIVPKSILAARDNPALPRPKVKRVNKKDEPTSPVEDIHALPPEKTENMYSSWIPTWPRAGSAMQPPGCDCPAMSTTWMKTTQKPLFVV